MASPDLDPERIRASPQWAGKRFINPIETPVMTGSPSELFSSSVRFMFRTPQPPGPLPVVQDGLEHIQGPVGDELVYVWLGHSSFVVELDGVRLLIDPVFGPRASPVGFAGPRRFQPPPLNPRTLPELDAVLISHNHYDHLDRPTWEALRQERARILVPLGTGKHLRRFGIPERRIEEFDWGDSLQLEGLRLEATEARHFSGRGVADRNRELWMGWSIRGSRQHVYYGGDTGYGPHFRRLGERLPPIDLAILENGAYNEQWRNIHTNPGEHAVAMADLGARNLIPVHWGMFPLSTHAWDDPVEQLLRTRGEGYGIRVPKLGELIGMEDLGVEQQTWWREVV